jgi:mannose-1-phosphate guanylyltransferase
MQSNHYYALIMAGGGGTRLWPLSRQAHPKQMLALVDETQSMFRVTVGRLQPLFEPSHVFVVTGQDMVASLMADMPEVPAENFIVEPFGRNSGPAAGLGTAAIMDRDPEAIIATLSADHHIADAARYREVLLAAAELAVDKETIVTLGVTPDRPATEFGYIKRGESLGVYNEFECFNAANFTEKPNGERALEFLSTGLYSWNCGMFITTAKHLLSEFERQQPDIHRLLHQISQHIGVQNFSEVINPLWQQMPNISLDYAVMENAGHVAVIPVDIGWSDIGSWDLLYEVLEKDEHGNIARGEGDNHIQIDSANTMVIGDRVVVTIGVEDLVIVDTNDVILVCHRSRAQDVREAVQRLRNAGASNYL